MKRAIVLVTLILLTIMTIVIVIPTIIVSLQRDGQVEGESEQMVWEGPEVKVLMTETGTVVKMPLEEYLVGVVAAEMPAKFHIEALKAQAVAARTYTLKKMESTNDRHPEADICDDPNHCQAFLTDEEMQRRWGVTGYAQYKSKIARAVRETAGIVITHQGNLVEPVYHSTSGGKTENSENVWTGTAVPYLRSVDCIWDSQSPRYEEQSTISWSELDSSLGTSLQAIPVSSRVSGNRGVIEIDSKTDTGRINQVNIGGRSFQATELRVLLGLNSTNFTYEVNERGITFNTTGFGHGVGMCQYGANGQAEEGRSFDQIIRYYYTGVDLAKIRRN